MMSEQFPKATHSGNLKIGNIEIPCAVLEDGTRVVSQRGFAAGLGGSKPTSITRRGAGNLPPFLASENLKQFIDKDLEAAAKPIPYIGKSGHKALGVAASAFPMICDVYLKARDAKKLRWNQIHLAQRADILMRGLAHIGIIALVDEATGYQADRVANALAKILEQYLAKELRKWVKTFPDDYYRELFKLRNWIYDEKSTKRAPLIGKLTNNIVYDRIAPWIRKELEKRNPKLPSGRRGHYHHQHFSEDFGHPRLREHLSSVITLMKISPNWRKFMEYINRALPKQTELPLFDEVDKAKDINELLPAGDGDE
jgi:hypothetical protein